ncbi:response regulator transcription factor [Dethiobacter alkaliphilus]|uniref:Two component transcriptional regulator, LuxR family n=1 Tax=Dethiobacter alkaliphilus AHT 1 TaxID=555088 RepID=C0GH41_DETAL|nr:response regulator transcription factor [Dethiobacter alkaliphilus]EEG77343.1 two component transcriptional regulator, LuxR family [Dethiobacter alkaliphilus AHT 1]
MGKITIILADDHAVVRESIRRLLEEREDLEVVGEAGDGENAVELVKNLKPRVVILDIAMPKLNGIEATRKIRELSPDTNILILSAYDYSQYVFALLEAGATGYLLKDVNCQELIRSIYSVDKGEPVLCPSVAAKVMQRFRRGEDSETNNAVDSLTGREVEVLTMVANGHRNQEIASRLYVSKRTVEAHLASIFSKLKVGSRTEAILFALKEGMISLEDVEVSGKD